MRMKMFRIVMSTKAIIEHSHEEMLRLENLIKSSGPEHIRATIWKDPITYNRVIDGQASPPMLHLLMTAAKGEKLTPVMDEFERKEE